MKAALPLLIPALAVLAAPLPYLNTAQAAESAASTAQQASTTALQGCPGTAADAYGFFQQGLTDGQNGLKATLPSCVAYRNGYTTGRNLLALSVATAQEQATGTGFTTLNMDESGSTEAPITGTKRILLRAAALAESPDLQPVAPAPQPQPSASLTPSTLIKDNGITTGSTPLTGEAATGLRQGSSPANRNASPTIGDAQPADTGFSVLRFESSETLN